MEVGMKGALTDAFQGKVHTVRGWGGWGDVMGLSVEFAWGRQRAAASRRVCHREGGGVGGASRQAGLVR